MEKYLTNPDISYHKFYLFYRHPRSGLRYGAARVYLHARIEHIGASVVIFFNNNVYRLQ